MKYVFIICALFWNMTRISVAVPEKAQVMELLEGRHWSLDAEAFQSLGEGTDKILIEISADKSLINYLRFRALEALSLFPSENTAVFLESAANDSFAPLARRGFEALRRGFFKTQPKRVKNAAARLLKHRNAQVRISAARFMRSVDAPRFKHFLKSEKNSWVRKAAQE